MFCSLCYKHNQHVKVVKVMTIGICVPLLRYMNMFHKFDHANVIMFKAGESLKSSVHFTANPTWGKHNATEIVPHENERHGVVYSYISCKHELSQKHWEIHKWCNRKQTWKHFLSLQQRKKCVWIREIEREREFYVHWEKG